MAKVKTFILFRPFVAFFRYLRNAWKEIRQVRWPSRKDTWKMVFAVIVYTLLFVAVILLLDLFFRWLFSLILGN
ncbi:preprotein translocase subunit SecE [Candidatus Saccharibacteria bacterium]|nr:preprotein translocase subunit SecE [Candidatus Saccharibacteria bacterium]